MNAIIYSYQLSLTDALLFQQLKEGLMLNIAEYLN